MRSFPIQNFIFVMRRCDSMYTLTLLVLCVVKQRVFRNVPQSSYSYVFIRFSKVLYCMYNTTNYMYLYCKPFE